MSLTHVATERLYEALAAFIVLMLEDEAWESASLHAEISDDDYGLTYGRYIVQPGGPPHSFATDDTLYFIFDELRRRMRHPDRTDWTAAQFTLQRAGAFDLAFSYPAVPEMS